MQSIDLEWSRNEGRKSLIHSRGHKGSVYSPIAFVECQEQYVLHIVLTKDLAYRECQKPAMVV